MPSNRSAHDRLLALQKKIHRSLQQQATRLLGEMPEAIRRYEREYREDFKRIPSRPSIVLKEELIREIRKSDVTLIGDYHTFAQAQRTALRLLREAVQKNETWYLGLEMIPSHRQEALDRFQQGLLSEQHFLAEIGYEEEWGFPWRHYAPIIQWAIQNQVRLIALNRPTELTRIQDDLYQRDRWASGIITDLFQSARAAQLKRPRMIALYGELHIGKKHLPLAIKETSSAALKRPLRTLILHQNQDDLYWRMASQGKELEAQVIRLRQRSYCVLSSPPWTKWQSVINWAEGSLPGSGASADRANQDLENESDERDEIDPLSLMTQYAGIVSEFFKLSKPSFDGLDVYTIRNADFIDHIDQTQLKPIERRLIRYHILHHHRIYLPSAPLAYLGAPSENGAAEIASIHLFRSAMDSHLSAAPSTSRKKESRAETFYQWILEHSFGFLGSLVLNPKRKCDLISDHEQRIEELKKGAAPSYPHERQARELAYLILSSSSSSSHLSSNSSASSTPSSSSNSAWTASEFSKTLDEFLKNSNLAPALYFAARYVGFAFAKQVHHTLLEEKLEIETLKKIYLGEPDSALAPPFWRFHSLRSAALKSPLGPSKTESL